MPWNLWNFMELRSVFKMPFLEKSFSKSMPINTTQNGLAQAQR